MEEYKKLLASHRTVPRRCSNEEELRRLAYQQLSSPLFDLYQPNASQGGSQQQSQQSQVVWGVSQSQQSQRTAGTEDQLSAVCSMLQAQSRSLAASSRPGGGDVLSAEKRKTFQGVVLVVRDLISKGKLKKGALAKSLSEIRGLPLEVLWWYHTSEILHINIYIALNLQESCELERISQGLSTLLGAASPPQVEGVSGLQVGTDLTAAMATLVHGPEPPPTLQDARRACSILLDSILRRRVRRLLQEAEQEEMAAQEEGKKQPILSPWVERLVGPHSPLPRPLRPNLAFSLLRTLLTEPPLVSVRQALTSQHRWNLAEAPCSLSTACSQVASAVGGAASGLEMVRSVLLEEGREVNWRSALVFVSSLLHTFPQTSALLSEMVRELISRGLVSVSISDRLDEPLLLGLLLARQSCAEASGVSSGATASTGGGVEGCVSYPVWFRRTFGSRQHGSAPLQGQSASACRALLHFLTLLVPHEPYHCLRAHLDQPPSVPGTCRSVLQDYLTLANTRLRDLQQQADPAAGNTDMANSGFFPSDPPATSLEAQARVDVEKAVAHFHSTGKIHQAVLQGSIFKKKYFENNFVPELLTPRSLGATNDPHMLLVDKLLAGGKISAAQFQTFHSLSLQKPIADPSG